MLKLLCHILRWLWLPYWIVARVGQ